MSFSVRIHRLIWQWVGNIENASWPSSAPLPADSRTQLIQMQNGLGKTTTLYLLRSLFTGLPPDSTSFARARYKGPLESERPEGPSELAVDLLIDGKPWILGIKLWPEHYTHEFYTVSPKAGRIEGWHPPESFVRTFGGKEHLAGLFLFDTQQAGAMTQSLPRSVVDGAIVEVANLGGLQALIGAGLEDVYKGRIKNLKAPEGPRVLARITNAIESLETYVAQREGEVESLTAERADLEEQSEEYVKERKRLHDKSILRERLETVRAEIDGASRDVRALSEQLLKETFNPANLPEDAWEEAIQFYGELDELRIPEVIAREVVESILHDGECICGEPLQEHHRANLHEYQERMSGAVVVQEVFHIKDSVRDASSGASGTLNLQSRLVARKKELDKKKTTLRRLESSLDSDVQARIQEIDTDLAALAARRGELDSELRARTSTDSAEIARNSGKWLGKARKGSGELSSNGGDYQHCRNLKTLKEALDSFKKRQASAAGAAQLRRAHKLVQSALGDVFERVLQQTKEALVSEANRYLPKLQRTGMTVHSLVDGMVLQDGQGKVQRGANTGGELSAQYSFLMALRSLGGVDLPMVIDNPTKGLDGTATSAFQENLPAMFDQCMMLIYPMERAGLGRLIGQASHLATLHREDEDVSGAPPSGLRPKGQVVVNEDTSWFTSYDPPSVEGS